jgi:hypothetical protein
VYMVTEEAQNLFTSRVNVACGGGLCSMELAKSQ